MTTNKLGHERASYLLRRADANLALQVERAMSNGIGAASAAVLVRSAMSERAQQEGAERVRSPAQAPITQWPSPASILGCKRIKMCPRPPFDALADDVQPKAMPSRSAGVVEYQDPSESHAVNATSYSPGRAIRSCSAGPPAKAMPRVKEKKSKRNWKSRQSPVEPPEEDTSGPAFPRLAQDNWGCDLASPKFGHCAWGGGIQKTSKDLC